MSGPLSRYLFVIFRTLARDRRTWDGFCAFGWPRFLAVDLLRDLLQEFVPGIRVFIRSLQSKVCVSRSGGPERVPPGASEEAFFRAFSIQDENKVMFFLSNLCWGHFLRHFSDFFWKIGDPQIPRGTCLRLKHIGSLKCQAFFSLGPFFEKVPFSNFRIRNKITRKLPGGTPAPLLLQWFWIYVFFQFCFTFCCFERTR